MELAPQNPYRMWDRQLPGIPAEEHRARQSPEYSGKRRQPRWQSPSLVKRSCLSELGRRTIKDGPWHQCWAFTHPCTWPLTRVQTPTHMPTDMHTWTDSTQRRTLGWKRGQGNRRFCEYLWVLVYRDPSYYLFVVSHLALSSPAPHSAQYRSSWWSVSLTSRNAQAPLGWPWRYGYAQMSPSKANSMSQTCI